MQELEKILEDIEDATRQEDAPIYCGSMEVDGYVRMSVVKSIIRKHMSDRKGAITMTENEIIDFLEDEINGLKEQKYGNLGEIATEVFKEINGDERIKVFRMAITALKEIQQYREIGTVEECREAVEKQKAKKPVLRNDNGKLRKSCPVCGCFFSPLSRSCPKCGQAIDDNLEGMEEEQNEIN